MSLLSRLKLLSSVGALFRPQRWVLCLLVLLGLTCSKPPASLKPISFDRWNEALTALRGDIVVVNVWASWCRTCVELFPSVVSLYRDYEPEGIRFLSVNLDDHDDLPAIHQAERLLVEQQATFPHYLLREDMAETFANLDLEGIPAVLVYDAQGHLQYRLEGDAFKNEISPADIEDAIESLR